MELVSILNIVFKRAWIIVGVTFGTLLLAAVFSLYVPSTYLSSAQLATGITDAQTVSLSDNAEVNNYYSTENKFSNLIENIRSRQVLSLLSYRLILHDLEESTAFRTIGEELYSEYPTNFAKTAPGIFKNKLDSIQVLSSSDSQDLPYLELLKEMNYDNKSLKENLTIYRIPSTDYIKIEFTSENPALSAFVVNTLCKEFIRYYVTTRNERSTNSVTFLTQLVNDKKTELDEKVNALKDFKSYNEVVNLNVQSQSIIDQIRELEVKREEERKKMIGLEQTHKRLTAELGDDLTSSSQPNTELVNSKILTIRDQIGRINQQLLDAPDNAQLQKQLQQLRLDLQEQIRIANNAVANTAGLRKQELLNNKINNEVDLEIARTIFASLSDEITRLRKNISGFASKEAQISALEREISVSQDAYLTMLDKLNSARLASKNVGNALSQIEMGYPADEPVKSKKILLILLSGAVSFSFSVITIGGLALFNHKPQTPQQLTELTGLVAAGYTNKIKPKYLSLEAISGSNAPEIETYRENLRKIRHELEHSQKQVFLFSSLQPQEGKTAIMLSLAYSLTLNMKKVLLLDTNFKNNRLTRKYRARPMLEKFLRDQQPDIDQLTSGTAFKGIEILGSEGGKYSPSELFAQIDMPTLLSLLKEKYDYIFMEGAALSQYSDTHELLDYSEAVVHVFDAESPLNTAHLSSLSSLKDTEKPIYYVLNKLDPKDL